MFSNLFNVFEFVGISAVCRVTVKQININIVFGVTSEDEDKTRLVRRPRRFGEAVGSKVVLPLFIRGPFFSTCCYICSIHFIYLFLQVQYQFQFQQILDLQSFTEEFQCLNPRVLWLVVASLKMICWMLSIRLPSERERILLET